MLAAMLVSGDQVNLTEFHHTLAPISQQDYDKQLLKVKRRHVTDGLTFAMNGKLIRMHLL